MNLPPIALAGFDVTAVQAALVNVPRKTIFIQGQPYLTRYFIVGGETEVGVGARPQTFIHHFHSSDQDRELHDHPWCGTSIILAGGYTEERLYQHADGSYTEVVKKTYRPGDTNIIGPGVFHRATLLDETLGAWTLFFTTVRTKQWGFLEVNSKTFTPFERNPEAIP